MEKDNTILVKCKYCGCEFTTDIRHPQACCYGSQECKRAAARIHSRKHFHSLKDHYASQSGREDPYHRMLASAGMAIRCGSIRPSTSSTGLHHCTTILIEGNSYRMMCAKE